MPGGTPSAPKAAYGSVLLVAPVPPPYGGMALQAGQLLRLMQQDGVSVELLGHNHAFSRPRFLETIPGVRTVLRMSLFCVRFWRKAGQAEVVHILAASWLNFLLVAYPAVLLARLRRKRVILNYRSGDAARFFRLLGWLVRPAFLLAQVNTTPSAFLAGVIQRQFGVQVSIVPNFINLSAFGFRERRVFQPKMLVTRHLEPLYDVESVLRAFREIQFNYPAASLLIAGTGSLEKRLRELVTEWQLENVTFLGHVEHKALPAIYDQCDFLLNASRIDNFPGSLMEASAAGLAVVTTKAGGIPFVYEDGKTALLAEIGDWKELGLAVQRVLQNPELGHRLAMGGFELSRQHEWNKIRSILYGIYGSQFPHASVQTPSAAERGKGLTATRA